MRQAVYFAVAVLQWRKTRSHVLVFDRPAARAQLRTLITSPVLIGRSNDPERCDQAVVHAQWSAKDRNSISVLFFLYRRRTCRCNRLKWVHPIIQKKRRIRRLVLHYLTNYEITQTSFWIIFECQLHISTGCIADWRRVFSVVTVKWGTASDLQKCWLLQSGK